MHVVLASSALDSNFNIKILAAMKILFLAKSKRTFTQELVASRPDYDASSENVWWVI